MGVGYTHAGQNYSSASIAFTGTGTSVNAGFNEFRNDAISQVRLIDPADSSRPGGLNYQTLLNNAQGGTSFTIALSAADTTGIHSSEYSGLIQ